MDIDRDKRVQKEKRKIKLIKRLMILGILLGIIIYFSVVNINNRTIYKIGEMIDSLYSENNFVYKEIIEGNENNYTLIKRLNDKIYYEKSEKDGENIYKELYYFDLKRDKAWKILEDEKIVITDELLNFTPIILSGTFENVNSSLAENYVYSYYNNKNSSSMILSFKSIINKKIDGKNFYQIYLKTAEGDEKTYFDKETFIPIKSIIIDKKENKTIKNIEYKKGIVTNQDMLIPVDYKIMTKIDYMEYKRAIDL